MIYFILILLFIAVFVFLTRRILTSVKPVSNSETPEEFFCPVCNEHHCECYKKPREK